MPGCRHRNVVEQAVVDTGLPDSKWETLKGKLTRGNSNGENLNKEVKTGNAQRETRQRELKGETQ